LLRCRRPASDLRWDFWWFRPGNRSDGGEGEPAGDGGAGGQGKSGRCRRHCPEKYGSVAPNRRAPRPSSLDTYPAAARTACQLATGRAPASARAPCRDSVNRRAPQPSRRNRILRGLVSARVRKQMGPISSQLARPEPLPWPTAIMDLGAHDQAASSRIEN
jgi:hypothetical protein